MNSSDFSANDWACCNGFRTCLSLQDYDGFSIVPMYQQGYRQFFLRACPVTPHTITEIGKRTCKLSIVLDGPDTKILDVNNFKLDMFQVLAFCPFCGANLQDLIDQNVDAFDSIRKNSAQFF